MHIKTLLVILCARRALSMLVEMMTTHVTAQGTAAAVLLYGATERGGDGFLLTAWEASPLPEPLTTMLKQDTNILNVITYTLPIGWTLSQDTSVMPDRTMCLDDAEILINELLILAQQEGSITEIALHRDVFIRGMLLASPLLKDYVQRRLINADDLKTLLDEALKPYR